MTEVCFVCENPTTTVREARPFKMGNRSAVVEHVFNRCSACGEEFMLAEQMVENQKRGTAAIRAAEQLLSSNEIREIRERLGLTQEAFERLLGIGRKTVVRWENGTVFQNSSTDSLLRVIRELPEAARVLAEKHGVEIKGFQRKSEAPPTRTYVSAPGAQLAQYRTIDDVFWGPKSPLLMVAVEDPMVPSKEIT